MLDCHVAATVAKDGGMCTAQAHPKALLAPYIHHFMVHPHMNSMFSCKCSCCRFLSHRIYGKMYLLLLDHRDLKQTELSDVYSMFLLQSGWLKSLN